MIRRPTFHLIQGGLTQEQQGIYQLRQPRAPTPEAEVWPAEGEWRRLIRSLLRTATNAANGE